MRKPRAANITSVKTALNDLQQSMSKCPPGEYGSVNSSKPISHMHTDKMVCRYTEPALLQVFTAKSPGLTVRSANLLGFTPSTSFVHSDGCEWRLLLLCATVQGGGNTGGPNQRGPNCLKLPKVPVMQNTFFQCFLIVCL